jgi:hypothetical protein
MLEWYTVGALICTLAFVIAVSERQWAATVFFAAAAAFAFLMVRRATR